MKYPDFVKKALKAARSASRKVRAEHRRLKLPVIYWVDGKVIKQKV